MTTIKFQNKTDQLKVSSREITNKSHFRLTICTDFGQIKQFFIDCEFEDDAKKLAKEWIENQLNKVGSDVSHTDQEWRLDWVYVAPNSNTSSMQVYNFKRPTEYAKNNICKITFDKIKGGFCGTTDVDILAQAHLVEVIHESISETIYQDYPGYYTQEDYAELFNRVIKRFGEQG